MNSCRPGSCINREVPVTELSLLDVLDVLEQDTAHGDILGFLEIV